MSTKEPTVTLSESVRFLTNTIKKLRQKLMRPMTDHEFNSSRAQAGLEPIRLKYTDSGCCNHDANYTNPEKGILLCSKCGIQTGTFEKKEANGEEYYQINFSVISTGVPFEFALDPELDKGESCQATQKADGKTKG